MDTPNCHLCKEEPKPAEAFVHVATAKTPYKPLCKKHLEIFETAYAKMKEDAKSEPEGAAKPLLSPYVVLSVEDGVKALASQPQPAPAAPAAESSEEK